MSELQPNILLIMSDQHHPGFLGCAGHEHVRTPHLDALANSGTRFNQAYCNFPLCCPSRMSFMTSRLPSEIDCLTNLSHLDTSAPTFAHAFTAGGYETVLCGRMHFNGPDQRHGFMRRIAADVHTETFKPGELAEVLGPELCRATGPTARAVSLSGPGVTGYQAYDEYVTTRATQWLRGRTGQPSERPFMMVVGLVLPHAPFVATPEDYALYDADISLGQLPPAHSETLHPALKQLQRQAGLEDGPVVPAEDQRRARVAYHGLCTQVDRQVGRILAALEESGLAENTIVVYTSDHGEQLGEHGMWWKHTFYESSIGVPLIMSGPGIPAGAVVNQNVSLMDIGPTLLDLAGAPELPGASGHSFRCLLEDQPDFWSNTVFAEHYWTPLGEVLHCMVKRGPWKLCHYPGFAPQLFNLEMDPYEEQDRSEDPSCQDILRDMMGEVSKTWNQEAIMARRQKSILSEHWLREWRLQSDLPPVDEAWHRPPMENWVDTR